MMLALVVHLPFLVVYVHSVGVDTESTEDLMRRVECNHKGCMVQKHRSSRRRMVSSDGQVAVRPTENSDSISSSVVAMSVDEGIFPDQMPVAGATSSSNDKPYAAVAGWFVDIFNTRHLTLDYDDAQQAWWGKLIHGRGSLSTGADDPAKYESKKTPERIKHVQLIAAGIMVSLVALSSAYAYAWVVLAERYIRERRSSSDQNVQEQPEQQPAGRSGSSAPSGETGSSSVFTGETGGTELDLPDDGGWWRWRACTVGSLVCMNVYIITYAIVALQKPLQKYMEMNLLNYNFLIGFRFFPAMFASLYVPYLQAKVGSGKAVIWAACICGVGAMLQMVAMISASYHCLLVSNIGLEVCLGMVTAIIPAVSARIMQGNEQSVSLSLLHLLGTVGMMAPLVILPAMLDHLSLPMVICAISLASAANMFLASWCYNMCVKGRLPLEIVDVVFSSPTGIGRQDTRLVGLIAIIVLIGTVSVTCRENVGGKLEETFGLTLDEVGVIQFVGILFALISSASSLITDRYGQRPFIAIGGHFMMLLGLECIRSKISAMGTVTLFGAGFGLCFNSLYSLISLIVPGSAINQVLAVSATFSYLAFTILPVLYGYVEMYYTQGVALLESVMLISLVITVYLSWTDMYKHNASMYGTQKYDERIEERGDEQQQGLLRDDSR